ncbi:MAG: hypothetical protein GYA24_01425, partial [Candidatus Lokiarchaeota archaeon]|nr:hypothetical protein [Candidatus Lokiarchaeota archaeon]
MDRHGSDDGMVRRQVAALLAIGTDPAEVSKASGIPVEELPGIVKADKEAIVSSRVAAKRGADVRRIVLAAAAHQNVLSMNPWASPPADALGIVRKTVEIDPKLAGLDRHLLFASVLKWNDTLLDDVYQVGVEDAWTSLDVLAGRYVVPAGAGWTEGWHKEVSWGRIKRYVDITVESMAQSINPSSLLMLRGVMDWGLWGLRAEHVVKHDAVIERFDAYKNRAIVESPARDRSNKAHDIFEHEFASRLIGEFDACDKDTALAYHAKHAWAPFIEFDPAWREEWLDRLAVIFHDLPSRDTRVLDAFATMLPVATTYTGEARTYLGHDKASMARVAVVDALVPVGKLSIMLDRVLAVAAHVAPRVTIMPECKTLPIPYPDGYPTTNITRIYRPGGTRATALHGQRVA